MRALFLLAGLLTSPTLFGQINTGGHREDLELFHCLLDHRDEMEDRPIHRRDPLFAEVFRHADAIDVKMETEKGIHVRETSSNPYVVKLIKAHADVVSRFIENGRSEMHKDHPVPGR